MDTTYCFTVVYIIFTPLLIYYLDIPNFKNTAVWEFSTVILGYSKLFFRVI